ncbi:MAG: dTDP-4-dehydrorhamnose 3,5-epimerase [Chlamydiae bacterium]|nr:dTDP-4-dehydrorhamnose 3,5-epimerase [Chlamydiota bacterium]MBI3276556.1 dTDP-4-dehydrorhamnose 3,5-epimerase [Chlamydiota bacterium]
MKFTPLSIPDVILIEPKVLGDERGFFYESYREDIFSQNGITTRFVQDNHSQSMKGVLRGLHFQIPPRAQAKLVRVVRGDVFDVAVDLRKKSKTFGKYVSEHLSETNKKMMYIPEGFAHGFCVLKDGTEFLYKCSDVYSPQHEHGLRWNDPSIRIPWPKLDMDFILSSKDQTYPSLKELKEIFV